MVMIWSIIFLKEGMVIGIMMFVFWLVDVSMGRSVSMVVVVVIMVGCIWCRFFFIIVFWIFFGVLGLFLCMLFCRKVVMSMLLLVVILKRVRKFIYMVMFRLMGCIWKRLCILVLNRLKLRNYEELY